MSEDSVPKPTLKEYFRLVDGTVIDKCIKEISDNYKSKEISDIITEACWENLHLEGVIIYGELKSRKYDRHIYIFGENHEDNATCNPTVPQISFGVFLKYILDCDIIRDIKTKEKKFVDVFLEVPHIGLTETITEGGEHIKLPEKQAIYQSKIGRTIQIFKGCFEISKEECVYKDKARFHYSDFRRIVDEPTMFYEVVWGWLLELDEANKSGDKENTKNVAKKIISVSDKFPFFKDTKDMMLGNHTRSSVKLNKQLNSIPYSGVKEKILDYFNLDGMTILWESKLEPFLRGIARDEISQQQSLDEKIAKYSKEYIQYWSHIMDIYTMARILRTFEILGENSPQNPKSPQNIFIYAGASHSKKYIEFLRDELDFEVLSEYEKIMTRGEDACFRIPEKLKNERLW